MITMCHVCRTPLNTEDAHSDDDGEDVHAACCTRCNRREGAITMSFEDARRIYELTNLIDDKSPRERAACARLGRKIHNHHKEHTNG